MDNLSSHTSIPIVNNSYLIINNIQLQFANNVRFFAASIQAKEKKEEKDTSGPRLNEQITAQILRLVTDEAIEPSDELDLESLLSLFSALIEDVAIVESEPRVDKQQAYVVVRHAKFGPSKKGFGKKVSKTTELTSYSAQKAKVSSQTVRSSSQNLHLNENTDAVKSGSKSDDYISPEELSDADVASNKSNWGVFKGEDDFNKFFDSTEDANGYARS
ncbi:translation initiation factor IF3-1, mitochondrial-like [Olea europaea subsp. europaea]|uniref:Translation initiation factor IF3-1, mitochondrial-like n=1 Tax=Olea europaea subsp. europaea TaxID=158383 RepID=A0A8S0RGW2_OLEEU|nr:translation initiation factor IF3-1, mitochondrial-like [Olea europaea subsp. europaea]